MSLRMMKRGSIEIFSFPFACPITISIIMRKKTFRCYKHELLFPIAVMRYSNFFSVVGCEWLAAHRSHGTQYAPEPLARTDRKVNLHSFARGHYSLATI